MQIKIQPVTMGYILSPINKNIVEKVDSYMLQYGIEDGSDVFLQEHISSDVQEDFNLSSENLRDLEHGWSVVKNNIDSWTYLNYVGYNACEDCKL